MSHPDYSTSLKATGDIRPCRFVKAATAEDFGCTECDANERPIGISDDGTRAFDSTNRAIDNDAMKVYLQGAECLLELGSGGATAGADLKSDADGKGVLAATTGTTAQEVGAIALEAGSAGDKIRVRVFIQTKVYPALA